MVFNIIIDILNKFLADYIMQELVEPKFIFDTDIIRRIKFTLPDITFILICKIKGEYKELTRQLIFHTLHEILVSTNDNELHISTVKLEEIVHSFS